MFPIVINYIFHLATASIAHRTSFFDLPWYIEKRYYAIYVELILYDGKDM